MSYWLTKRPPRLSLFSLVGDDIDPDYNFDLNVIRIYFLEGPPTSEKKNQAAAGYDIQPKMVEKLAPLILNMNQIDQLDVRRTNLSSTKL